MPIYVNSNTPSNEHFCNQQNIQILEGEDLMKVDQSPIKQMTTFSFNIFEKTQRESTP